VRKERKKQRMEGLRGAQVSKTLKSW